jgi:hypothetical protein
LAKNHIRVLTALAREQLRARSDSLPLVDLAAQEIKDALHAREVLQLLIIEGWIELDGAADAGREGAGRVTDAGLAVAREDSSSGRYDVSGHYVDSVRAKPGTDDGR